MKVLSAFISEQGPVRTINADAVVADDNHFFYAIADGIGSSISSAEASQFLVNEARQQFIAQPSQYTDAGCDTLIGGLVEPYAERFGRLPKIPGSTLSVAWVNEGELRYSSVGDSPIFLIDGGRAQLLTREHTAADRNSSVTSFSDLKFLSGSNILVNSFGANPARPIKYPAIPLSSGQRLVMCSDGLMEVLDQRSLGAASENYARASDLIRHLGKMAMRAHVPDNYSAIAIDFQD